MPQINQLPFIFASQLFWLLVVFGIIYFFIGRGMVPKIQSVVEQRDTKIAEDLAAAVIEAFKEKLIRRQQSLKILDAGEPRQSGRESKITVTLKEGITSEDAKKVGKLIRDEGPKGVKVQVQGDELRVSSKKRDDLQAVQALVKAQDYDFAVQFTNYR